LKALDIVPDVNTQNYSSFTVELSSLIISGEHFDNQDYLPSAIPVLLDSGTTLTYLPPSVVAQIYDSFHAVDDTQDSGLVYVSCSLLSDQKDTTFDFQFGDRNGPLIRVPINEMVLDNIARYEDLGLQVPSLPFDDVCSFGIQPLSGLYLLGDTFLRSAYVVYDLSNKRIALAPANLNATDSSVLEITKASGIPLVSGVASQVSVTYTATGLPGTGGHSMPTDAPTSASAAPTVTVTQIPSESASGNAAPQVVPGSSCGATVLILATALWSLTGAGLFIL
jgi:hypothetical protein